MHMVFGQHQHHIIICDITYITYMYSMVRYYIYITWLWVWHSYYDIYLRVTEKPWSVNNIPPSTEPNTEGTGWHNDCVSAFLSLRGRYYGIVVQEDVIFYMLYNIFRKKRKFFIKPLKTIGLKILLRHSKIKFHSLFI